MFTLIILLTRGKDRETRRNGESFAHFIFILMLIYAIHQFAISIFIIKKICIMCTVLYVLSIAIVIASKHSLRMTYVEILQGAKCFFTKSVPFGKNTSGVIASGISLVIGIWAAYGFDEGLFRYFNYKQNRNIEDSRAEWRTEQSKKIIEEFNSLPKNKISTTDSPWVGGKDAKAVLVEYSDFECPACAMKAFALKDLLKKFGNKIKIYFKNYPLDQSCNKNITRPFHLDACRRAFLGVCFNKLDLFWKYHEFAFTNQQNFSDSFLRQFMRTHNVDEAAINNCLKTANEVISRDIAEATLLRINGTPTMYLNNKKISDLAGSEEDLNAIIESIISK